MKPKPIITVAIVFMLAGWCVPAMAAETVITGVPDWNQPNNYWAATPGLNFNDAPQWCSPTAAADLMGYWDDVKGANGLTDGAPATSFPNPPNGNPDHYKQSLWHDGTIEIGWFMNTGGWQQQGPPPNWPAGFGGTLNAWIGPGAVAYAMGSWNDPDGSTVKTGFPNASSTTVTNFQIGGVWQGMTLPQWTAVMNEIDSDKPALMSFFQWVDTSVAPAIITVDGQSVEQYGFDAFGSEPHTVCLVGYQDPTPLAYNGDELIIAQDNWSTTGQYVAVTPIPFQWRQTDYIDIPEPFTLALLGVGSLVLVRRRRR